MPKILTTGKGSSGSWQCRGVQLGGLVGDVRINCMAKDFKRFDAVIWVKRITASFLQEIRKSKTPWIWDLVDFYPQPQCGKWSRDQAISWVRGEIKRASPDGIIYPNQKMKDDIGLDGEVIYHHGRTDIPINEIRKQIQVVGYEGSEKFLGKWRELIEAQCKIRGWEFKIGIPINEMDIVVAFRDAEHNGYAQQNWKSNVKLANAHTTGTPFVGQFDSSYIETSSGHEVFVDHPRQIECALDYLSGYDERVRIHSAFIKNTIKLADISSKVKSYVETIL